MIFVAILMLWRPTYAQKYSHLLSETQKDSLSSFSANNTGLKCFKLDSNIWMCFGFNDKQLAYEYLKKDEVISGVSYSYKSGYLYKAENYLNGFLEGEVMYYYDNGLIKECGSYITLNTDSIIINSEIIQDTLTGELIEIKTFRQGISVKQGLWFYYDINGIVTRKEIWDKGICNYVSNW